MALIAPVLAVAGVVLVAVGFAQWSVPLAAIVLGFELLGAAYVTAYLVARRP